MDNIITCGKDYDWIFTLNQDNFEIIEDDVAPLIVKEINRINDVTELK